MAGGVDDMAAGRWWRVLGFTRTEGKAGGGRRRKGTWKGLEFSGCLNGLLMDWADEL
jgi:hypothetical protein